MGATISKEQAQQPFGYLKKESDAEFHQTELEKSNLLVHSYHTINKVSPLPQLQEFKFCELKSLITLNACNSNLLIISDNIQFLKNTTRLMLCCNSLTEIPDSIGYMRNLTNLSLANNKIVALPDTLGYLEKLTELTVSNNELVYIPCSIGLLKNLTTLSLQRNRLKELPAEIGKLKKLEMIDVSNNPLEVLPAETSRIFSLKLVRTNECPLLDTVPLPQPPKVLSLKEITARYIVRNQIPVNYLVHDQLQKYLTSSHECTFCKGPYFEQYESRIRIITRNNKPIPIESRLCIDHYDNELKRIEKLFSTVPATAPTRSSAPSTPNRSRASSNASVKEKTLHSSPSLPNLPRKEKKPKLIKRLSSAVLKTSLSMTFLREKNLH